MNEQPGAPKLLGRHIGEETIDENKELLAKIGSDSILKAPAIKGSIYFYVNSCSDGNQSKEELIDDPTALNAAIKNLSIEIKYENKHHRWGRPAAPRIKNIGICGGTLKAKQQYFARQSWHQC